MTVGRRDGTLTFSLSRVISQSRSILRDPQLSDKVCVRWFLKFKRSLTAVIAFTDAIAGDWGGKPFVDLQQGFKYVLQEYPEIDPDRAAAAGASWGGYAIKYAASSSSVFHIFSGLL